MRALCATVFSFGSNFPSDGAGCRARVREDFFLKHEIPRRRRMLSLSVGFKMLPEFYVEQKYCTSVDPNYTT